LALGAVLLLGVGNALAASAAKARVAAVNMDNFPNAEVWLTAWDASGRFLGGIKPQDVTVQEDGAPRPVVSFSEAKPGVQAVIAIQPGHALHIHDQQGVSRYQYIYNQITSWLDSHPKGTYDLTLYTTDGVTLSHTADLNKFRTALDQYKPGAKTDKVGIQALTEGLKLVTAPPPNPAMGRALLWITPLPAYNTVKDLNSYLQQAHQFNIHIYIWLVAPAEAAKTPEVQDLSKFAEATGGKLTLFSGVEVLPTLDQLWSDVDHAYRLVYQSAAIKGKEHSLIVTLHTSDGKTVRTPTFTFNFSLQPPVVTLSGLPERIVRKAPAAGTEQPSRFPPTVDVHFSVEFPDKHPRKLKRAVLLVDGKPAAQCSAFPCERMSWNIGVYERTAPHEVAVKVEDEYGIAAMSAPKTVQIVVERADNGLHAQVASHRSALVVGTVALSGLVLLAVLLASVVAARRRKKAAFAEGLEMGAVQSKGRGWRLPGLPRRRRGLVGAAKEELSLAYLVPLNPEECESLPKIIPITATESTIGSDPAQATIVVKHPSVSPTHARLWQSGEGAFYIADRRSEAGTWVNYAPVSAEGTLLQPGDLVHIGKVGFRFRLQPEEGTEIVVKAL